MPLLLVTPLPVGPAWATDTLAFLLGGIVYVAVGAAAHSDRETVPAVGAPRRSVTRVAR
jgi:hypothetical protein